MNLFRVETSDQWRSRTSYQTIGIATSARSAYKILKEYADKNNYELGKEIKHNIIGLINMQGDLIDKNDSVEKYNACFDVNIISTNELLA